MYKLVQLLAFPFFVYCVIAQPWQWETKGMAISACIFIFTVLLDIRGLLLDPEKAKQELS